MVDRLITKMGQDVLKVCLNTKNLVKDVYSRNFEAAINSDESMPEI